MPSSRAVALAQHRPLLGQHDELGARGGGLARQPVGRREVAVAVGGRGELYGGSTHCGFSSPRIDSSVNPRRSISSGHAEAAERVARGGWGWVWAAVAAPAAGADARLARRAAAEAVDLGRRARAPG